MGDFILIMHPYEDPDYWKYSARDPSLSAIQNLACYSDPPAGHLPKRSNPAVPIEPAPKPQCVDMTVVVPGQIYQLS